MTGAFALGGTWIVAKDQRRRDGDARNEALPATQRSELIELLGAMDRGLVELAGIEFWANQSLVPREEDRQSVWSAFARIRAARDPVIVEPDPAVTDVLLQTGNLMGACLTVMRACNGDAGEPMTLEHQTLAQVVIATAKNCGKLLAEAVRKSRQPAA